jgi:hypothetical protein
VKLRHSYYREAFQKAKDLSKLIARRMPDDLHRRRLRALYVEPSGNGTEWTRPSQTTREECLHLLAKAADEYDARCSWYEVNEREKSSWISHWTERPVLPKSISAELWPFTTIAVLLHSLCSTCTSSTT